MRRDVDGDAFGSGPSEDADPAGSGRSKRGFRNGARRALLAGLLLAAGPLHAADLPSRTTAAIILMPPLSGPYNWTGIYAGVNAGMGIDHFAFPYGVTLPSLPFIAGSSGIASSGAIAGAQVGANYQIFGVPLIGNLVLGIEADADWSGVRGATAIATPAGLLDIGTRFENFGTLRGRFGYGLDRLMVYFTGGLTFGTTTNSFALAAPGSLAGSTTVLRSGLFPRIGVVGLGAEFALTKNISVKAEYLYDFVGATQQFFPTGPASTVQFGSRSMYHIARLGLNYHFGLSSPPAALATTY